VRSEWRGAGVRIGIAASRRSRAELVAAATISVNGWLGRPGVKTGGFTAAHRPMRPTKSKLGIAQVVRQTLETGELSPDTVERVNLERELVAARTGVPQAHRGYPVKHQLLARNSQGSGTSALIR